MLEGRAGIPAPGPHGHPASMETGLGQEEAGAKPFPHEGLPEQRCWGPFTVS